MWLVGFGASLSLAMMAVVLAQPTMIVLAPFLIRDLELTRTQIGGLISIVFLVATVSAPVGGRIVDRLNPRWTIVALFVAASAVLAGQAAAPAFWWLLVVLAASGVSLGLVNSVTNQLISRYAPSGRRGLLIGTTQSGIKLAQLFAGAVLPGLALAVGWREAIVVAAALVLLCAVPALLVIPRDATSSRVQPDRPEPTGSAPIWWLTGYSFLMAGAQVAMLTYAPLFAVEGLGMSIVDGGAVLALVSVVSIATRVTIGPAAERMGSPILPLLLLSAGAVAAGLLVMSSTWAGSQALWAGSVIFGVCAGGWSVLVQLTILRMIPRARTGRATGTVNTGFFAATSLGPVLFGYTVDVTGNYLVLWGAMTGLFLAAAVLVVAWAGTAIVRAHGSRGG